MHLPTAPETALLDRPGSQVVSGRRLHDAAVADRPDQVGFNVVGKAMEINASMRFADSAYGTRMAAQFDLQPKGFMKLTMPLLAGAVRKDFPRQLTSFKEFCESSVDA
jgi:hypothetical protein